MFLCCRSQVSWLGRGGMGMVDDVDFVVALLLCRSLGLFFVSGVVFLFLCFSRRLLGAKFYHHCCRTRFVYLPLRKESQI